MQSYHLILGKVKSEVVARSCSQKIKEYQMSAGNLAEPAMCTGSCWHRLQDFKVQFHDGIIEPIQTQGQRILLSTQGIENCPVILFKLISMLPLFYAR